MKQELTNNIADIHEISTVRNGKMYKIVNILLY